MRWRDYVEGLREKPEPFEAQWARYLELYADRPAEDGPPRAWQPGSEEIERSNLARLVRDLGLSSYEELHRRSTRRREQFWGEVISRLGIRFSKPPARILSPEGRWLPGAELNVVESCFLAEPDATAVVWRSEGEEGLRRISYAELRAEVGRVAAGLSRWGLSEGDPVALFMPMTVECVVAYLAIVALGGRVVSIADSFSAEELGRRLEIAGATALISVAAFSRAGRRIDVYGRVREARAPRAIVIPFAGEPLDLREGDAPWADVVAEAAELSFSSGPPERPSNVLFSSGTTGTPKAIPWTHATPLKCAMDGHLHHDVRPGDVVAWPTNVGWMMGPWLIYASLLNRAAIALFDGAPHTVEFTRFVADAGVTMLGVIPSLVRAWRSAGVPEHAAWGSLRVISSTGEPSNREDYLWLMSRAGYRAPVVEYLGGTEIGGGYITGSVLQPASPATFTTPALGLDFAILDEEGRPVPPGGAGELFLIPPSIGLSETLLNRDHDEVYFAGCPRGPGGERLRRHGDQMRLLHRGFFRAEGRADDAMNLGGIKVSSVELEQVLAEHPSIEECAAIAVQPRGEGPEALVVYAIVAGEADLERLRGELGRLLARRLNPLFKLHDLVATDALPRTASNKLMRRELRRRWQEERGL